MHDSALPKAYEPRQYEDTVYKKWEESGLFSPDVCVEKGITQRDAESFSMVLPPPNVTGTLHMGHAVMLAIEDVMTRYHRMKGDRTLWIPGTDHAAVATESKVEKMLIEEGIEKPKQVLGREAFLKKVEEFAQGSHDTIVNQAKKMGASLDWSREAYTLDETRSRAVKTVFKKMYDDGLIYRGYRVVNWSVKGQSTCSDDELVYIDRPGKLCTFYYSTECPIPIATTRPETKLGDTAIAVHPEGQWKEYIGTEYVVEDFGQAGHTLTLRVIADESVDDEYGTGALGVTPAHSAVDFEMYSRQKTLGNDIGLIQVIGEDGKMTSEAGAEYVGLSVKEAREKLVEWLRTQGLLKNEEDITQNIGTSDRFGDIVEPLPKTQWFIDVNKKFKVQSSDFIRGLRLKDVEDGKKYSLKELMQTAVRSGQIQIVPDRFEKTYFHWIDNLRDWNISRQIWYGHQIPVWYKDEKIHVGDEPVGDGWEQDPDTLDTWFSSGLWTFSTLGWPDNTDDFKHFHPTSVLETGYDILFFWVARMILMTTYTLGDIPFETVYLHGLVRDEQGRKMSKSLGNIINPLDMSEKYGTDAVRLSLMVGTTPGNDSKLSEEKIGSYRNFANKLWNISRFMLMNIENPQQDVSPPETSTLADQWIMARLDTVSTEVTEHVEQYRFSLAVETLRDFTWNELADWYLEIAKIEGSKSQILNHIFNTLLTLWHPFMPFVTEAIWQEIYGGEELLMGRPWTFSTHTSSDTVSVVAHFAVVQELVTTIRSLRAEKNIEPSKEITVVIACEKEQALLDENAHVIRGLARVESLTISGKDIEKPETSVSAVMGGITLHLDLSGAIDIKAEKVRLQKEIDRIAPYVNQLEQKLANKEFVANAPESVVNQEKQKLAEARGTLDSLTNQLLSL